MSLISKVKVPLGPAGLYCLWRLWDQKDTRNLPRIPTQLVRYSLSQSAVDNQSKLLKKISNNMRDDLQRHIEGHRALKVLREQSLFFKKLSEGI